MCVCVPVRAHVVLAVLPAILSLGAASNEYNESTYTDSKCTDVDESFGSYQYKYLGGNCYQYVDGGSFALEQKSGDQIIGFELEDDSCANGYYGMIGMYEFSWSSWSAGECTQFTYPSLEVPEFGISINNANFAPTYQRLDRPLDGSHFPGFKASKTMHTAWNCTSDLPIWSFQHVGGNCYKYLDIKGSSEGSFTMACDGTELHMDDYGSQDCSGDPTGDSYLMDWKSFTTADSCHTYSWFQNGTDFDTLSEKFYVSLQPEDYPPSCTVTASSSAASDLREGKAICILFGSLVSIVSTWLI